MPQINQLPLVSQVSSGDQIPVYTPQNGDARRMPVSALLEFFKESIAPWNFEISGYSPANGFDIVVSVSDYPQWLMLQPVGSLATGNITLPPSSQLSDGAEILVTTTQTIASLSMTLSGASQIFGVVNPGTFYAQDHFRLKYAAAVKSWYRIG